MSFLQKMNDVLAFSRLLDDVAIADEDGDKEQDALEKGLHDEK